MIRKVPHVHVSEREVAHTWPTGEQDDARWEDCRYVAAVEWLRAVGRDIPATHAEAEAIRQAAGQGPLGGSTLEQLARGVKARFGTLLPTPVRGASEIVLALTRGKVAMVDGRMGNFPAGHRLRRWDPAFSGGHTVYVERREDGSLWWCDPLAPVGTYAGEVVTDAELRTFASWMYGQAVIGTVALVEESEMFPIVTVEKFPTPVRFVVPAGTTLRGYDPAEYGMVVKLARFARDSAAHADARVGVTWQGVPAGQSSPIPRGYPFLRVIDGMFAGLLIVEAQVRLDPIPDPAKLARAKALEEARTAAVEAVAKAIEALGH